MVKLLVVIFFVAITNASPLKDSFDKATVNDVGVNAVSHDSRPEQNVAVIKEFDRLETVSATAGSESFTPSSVVVTHTVTKPVPHAGSAFSRIIDDIFQIPITVLQSVARLLTNPFAQKSPETTVSKY